MTLLPPKALEHLHSLSGLDTLGFVPVGMNGRRHLALRLTLSPARTSFQISPDSARAHLQWLSGILEFGELGSLHLLSINGHPGLVTVSRSPL